MELCSPLKKRQKNGNSWLGKVGLWRYLSRARSAFTDATPGTTFCRNYRELEKHYEQIAGNHKIDYERFVVAGSSMGGALAAQPYLDRQIPCRRFILVWPCIKAPAELEESVKEFASEGGKGYVLVGDKDSGCIEGAGKPAELLNANGVECRIDILEDVGHEYTDGFQQYVEALLSFLLE